MKAVLRNYRQSSRKVRLVANAVRGASVKKAIPVLDTLNKKGALAVKKVINSAVANAKENFGKKEDDLFIKMIKVDEGRTLRRFRPRAFGRATRINKRLSHISLELGSLTSVEEKNKTTGAGEEKAEKKVVAPVRAGGKKAVKETTDKAAKKDTK